MWTHVDASLYEIYHSDDGGNTLSKAGEMTSTYSTYLDTTGTSGRTYVYYVRSMFNPGQYTTSSPVEISVPTARTRVSR